MAISIKSVLELYDLYVTANIRDFFRERMGDFNILFSPPTKEVGFRRAQEKFKSQKIFPILFVFRDSPPSIADENYSAMLYNLRFSDSDFFEYKNVNVFLDYNISFFSKDLYDMNMFSIAYYDFRSYRKIHFDFREIGLDFSSYVEVMFDDMQANNNIDTMYDNDLYFNYTFDFSILVPLFKFKRGIEVGDIVISLYDRNMKLVDIEGDG